MSTETTSITPSKSRKDTRKEIYQKLEQALGEYKSQFKEKRFQANLKKASRLFANGLGKKTKKSGEKSKKKKEKFKEVLSATNGVS